MSDLLVAIGLVMVIEGLLWAVAPQVGLRLLTAAQQMSDRALRCGRSGGGGGRCTGLAGSRLRVWLVQG